MFIFGVFFINNVDINCDFIVDRFFLIGDCYFWMMFVC